MLKILSILIICIIFLYSCNEEPYPRYRFSTGYYLPDSAKVKLSKWITETTAATNFHMTGGDYEDPEDVIEQLEETGNRIFSVNTTGLERLDCNGCYWEFIPKEYLAGPELVIFENLSKTK